MIFWNICHDVDNMQKNEGGKYLLEAEKSESHEISIPTKYS
jgi:hypothetical protein